MSTPDQKEEPKPRRESTDSTQSGLLSKLLQSQDSTSDLLNKHIFKSNDSSFLSSMMKSDAFKSGDPFKSNDSFLAKLMGSSDSKKSDASPSAFASLVRSTSDAVKSAASAVSNKIPDIFTSRDWVPKYASKHVDIDDIDHVFESENSGKTSSVPELVEKKQQPVKTDWEALYESQLAGSAAAVRKSPPPPQAFQFPRVAVKAVETKKKPAASNKRKRQKSEEAAIVFVKPTDADVLMGRGGRTNNHPGNKQYLHDKDAMQERYIAATKQAKTGISQELVDVVHARGGRFLKFDEDVNKWFEVSNTVARKKCSQTLREVNTPEQRAAKRARYKK